MRVLLVGSEGACGIAEHSAYLAQAVQAADDTIQIQHWTDLHPNSVLAFNQGSLDLVHVNYHSALHSQWLPSHFDALRRAKIPTVVTWHDSGVPNSDHCKSIHAVADAFVVHEPCEDLPGARYWRQGVPEREDAVQGSERRPIVGTVGFDFPWKNYNLLVDAARIAGWTTRIIAPKEGHFMDRRMVVSMLSGCDATAFLYNTHNTGTSGAIRQGIAARKPVIASCFPFGRQFRDLHADPLAARVITWVEPSLENVVAALSQVRIAPIDAGMVALAEQDSWARLGQKYAALYKELAHV